VKPTASSDSTLRLPDGFKPLQPRDTFGRATRWAFWISWAVMGAVAVIIFMAPDSVAARFLGWGLTKCSEFGFWD
jgi:hypothetical protein